MRFVQPHIRGLLTTVGLLLGFASCGRTATSPPSPAPVWVITAAPGYPAVEVEALVTAPLESSLSSVPGVARITSRSTAGRSVIALTAKRGTRSEVLSSRVHEALRRVRTLPVEIERPMVQRAPTRLAVFGVALTGPRRDPRPVQDALARVGGVVTVRTWGAPRPQLQVTVSPARLRAYGLTTSQLADALRRSAGRASGGPFLVRTAHRGAPGTIAALRDLPIRTTSGHQMHLRDLAALEMTDTPRWSCVLNDQPAVCLTVYAHAGPRRPPRKPLLHKLRAALPRRDRTLVEVDALTTHPLPCTVQARVSWPGGALSPAKNAARGPSLRRALRRLGSGHTWLLRFGPREGPGQTPIAHVAVRVPPQHAWPPCRRESRALRQRLRHALPDARVLPAPGTGRAVALCHRDRALLRRHGPRLVAALRRLPGLEALDDRDQSGAPTLGVQVDRRRLVGQGLRHTDVTQAIRLATGGLDVLQLQRGRDTVSITLRTGQRPLSAPTALTELRLTGAGGRAVPLGAVARLTRDSEPLRLHRLNRRPCLVIPTWGDHSLDLGRLRKALSLPAAVTLQKVPAQALP